MPADLKLILSGASLILLATAAITPFAGEGWLALLDGLHWTVSAGAAWAMAWLGAVRGDAGQYAYRRWFCYGTGLYFAGQCCWNLQELFYWNPFPAPADVFYLAMGPCFGVGLLTALRRHVSPARLLAAKLDTAAMTLALLGFILALYLPNAANADALELAVLAAYPLGLLSAASLALLAIPFLSLELAWASCVLPAALLVEGGVWMQWNLQALTGTNQGASLLNWAFSVNGLLVGLGAYLWRADAERSACRQTCRRVMRAIPVAALLVSAATLALVAVGKPEQRAAVFAAAAAGVSVLLLSTLRQSLLLAESEKLLEAEASMAPNEHGYRRSAAELREWQDSQRQALQQGELVLYYQPVFAECGDAVLALAGAEVLVYRRAARGEPASAEPFVAGAGQGGMSAAVGAWAVAEACRQLAAWRGQLPDRFKLWIGLSPEQFGATDTARAMAAALQTYRIVGQRLTFEVGEAALELPQALVAAEALSASGAGLALSRFGTGRSGLACLRQFPFRELKIDCGLVREIPGNASGTQLSAGIAQLAAGLGLAAAADGIETAGQLAFLRAAGYRRFQGAYLAEPLPAAAIPEFAAGCPTQATDAG